MKALTSKAQTTTEMATIAITAISLPRLLEGAGVVEEMFADFDSKLNTEWITRKRLIIACAPQI